MEQTGAMRDCLSFVLNGEPQRVRGLDPATTLLDYLRRERRLTGTKEGCAEGDCGACTVTVGELGAGCIRYRALNACILPMPMLEGRSVTTVEHLRQKDGSLHPVQQALVDIHASQCGYCTPGFVMSLYTAYLNGPSPGSTPIDDLLAGNLCRCTGYGPIVKAARAIHDAPRPPGETNTRADAIARHFRFLGLIGSATKRARFLKRLAELGIGEALLAQLVCPIGLPGIGGKEPAAIAVSVAAQLVQLATTAAACASAPSSRREDAAQ
jgi:xanthine dehydrogenase iron-sulfur cluster and FAD-binding subunit A